MAPWNGPNKLSYDRRGNGKIGTEKIRAVQCSADISRSAVKRWIFIDWTVLSRQQEDIARRNYMFRTSGSSMHV